MSPAERHTPHLYSIGHSNHPWEKFLALLQTHGIELLADVRSRPYSRFCPHFNIRALEAALPAAGMSYLFLGRELGGRPENPSFHDEAGQVLYDRIAQSEQFQHGIDRLIHAAAKHRVAMMCSEEDPTRCHRYHLITPVLVARGVEINHIRGDGRLQTDADIRTTSPVANRQQSLFLDDHPLTTVTNSSSAFSAPLREQS